MLWLRRTALNLCFDWRWLTIFSNHENIFALFWCFGWIRIILQPLSSFYGKQISSMMRVAIQIHLCLESHSVYWELSIFEWYHFEGLCTVMGNTIEEGIDIDFFVMLTLNVGSFWNHCPGHCDSSIIIYNFLYWGPNYLVCYKMININQSKFSIIIDKLILTLTMVNYHESTLTLALPFMQKILYVEFVIFSDQWVLTKQTGAVP